jgi:uncharacterized protein DUF5670
MLWTIIAVLVVLWLLGLIGGVGGSLIHALPVIAAINVGLQPGQRSPDTELTQARNHSICCHY